MLLKTVIEIDHEWVILSESSVSQIYFELVSISFREIYYNHSNALQQFSLELERCKLHKASRHPTKYDIINDVKLRFLSQIFDIIQSDVLLQNQMHLNFFLARSHDSEELVQS